MVEVLSQILRILRERPVGHLDTLSVGGGRLGSLQNLNADDV